MNAGQRGGAYGFKLSSVLKMIDTKSVLQQRKHTLLNYLVELVDKRFPKIAGFQGELSSVDQGAKVAVAQIRQAMVTIRDNLKQLNTLLEQLEEDSLKAKASKEPPKPTTSETLNLKFKNEMKSFYDEAQKVYTAMDAKMKSAEVNFEAACVLYAEDPKTSTPEEFFGVFAKFVSSFTKSKAENDAWIAKEEQERKRDQAKKTALEKTKKKEETTPIANSKEDAGLDDLISAIRTGKAFNNAPGQTKRRSVMVKTGEKKASDKPELVKELKTFQELDQGALRLKRN